MCRSSAGFFLLFCLLIPCWVFAQPASLTAAIGTPASGDAHYITLSWTELPGASYELQSASNGNNWISIYTGTELSYSHNTGSAGNAPFYYRVRGVINNVLTGWTNATQYPIYTACDYPALPLLNNPSFFGMSLTLGPDGNSAATMYSIYCPTTGKYVQANGTLGAGEIFQTKATWGVVAISGLEHSSSYCFYVKAKNNDGDIRMGSEAFMQPESFATNANFNNASGALTTKFWSPNACQTGGLEFKPTGGCTDGNIQYRKSFNNKFDCWLRTPEVNCTGSSTSAVLKFDFSNSYFADHPNDRIRFYLWDNTYVSGSHYFHATSVKINGVEKGVRDANGIWLFFDETRECVNVEVTFDFADLGLQNRDKLLFYIHPVCGYHDARMYSVKLDNISVQSSVSSACLATSFCSAASVESQPEARNACVNGITSFTVSASGNVATYQWQVSSNSGNTWADIANDWLYSNANTSTLNLNSVPATLNGYYYRCVISGACSSPLTSDHAILQTVQYSPSAAGIISGTTAVCQGQSGITYSLPAVSGAETYSWSLPAGATITDGAGTNSITVSFASNAMSGNIVAIPASVCGQGAASPAFNITVSQLPDMPGAIAGETAVCGVQNETYSIAPVNGATSYTWLLPGGWAGVSSTETIHVTTNGSGGTILVASNAACGSSAASALTVTGGTGPGIPASISGITEACPGDALTLIAEQVAGADSYVWTLPQGWSGISETDSITVTAGTSGGMLYIAAQNGCGTSAPQSIALAIKPVPSVVFDMSLETICSDASPRALVSGTPAGGVYSGAGVSFGVLFPDDAAPGVHLLTYEYEDASGCTGRDTALIRIEACTGMSAIAQSMFEVHPNPFTEAFNVKFTDLHESKTVLLYNAIGKELLKTNVAAGVEQLQIDLPASAASGIVFLKVIAADGNATEIRKLVRTL